MIEKVVSLVAVLVLVSGAMGASIAGTWTSPSGDVVYTQDGAGIRGDVTFPRVGTAKVVGVQIGNEVYFSYVRNTGEFGTGKMILSDDDNQLHGTFRDQSSGTEGEWTLTRVSDGPLEESAPETGVSVAGRWHSNLGETVFEQSGNHVTGSLTFVNGQTCTIEGDLEDRSLVFTYQLSNGENGHGQLTLSPDGASLRGTYQRLPDGQGGAWILASAEETPSEPEEHPATDDSDLTGQWSSNLGFVEFHNEGGHVTGTLAFPNGQRARIEGSMDHDALDFHYVHDNGSTGRGRIEFTSPDTMRGAYHDSRTGREAVWRLRRLEE